ncbi:hypothetical protein VPH35_116545 [Triticum aestivum]
MGVHWIYPHDGRQTSTNRAHRSMQGDGSSNRESDAIHDSPLLQVARAIGNFMGLKAPERKQKPGRPITCRDKPPYDDRGAKSKKYILTANAQAGNGCGTSKRTRFSSIC